MTKLQPRGFNVPKGATVAPFGAVYQNPQEQNAPYAKRNYIAFWYDLFSCSLL